VRKLAKDESDLVTEQRRRVGETTSESVDSGNSGRKVGRRAKVAEGEHGAVAVEKGEFCVEKGLFELFDGRLLCSDSERRSRVDRGKVAVVKSVWAILLCAVVRSIPLLQLLQLASI